MDNTPNPHDNPPPAPVTSRIPPPLADRTDSRPRCTATAKGTGERCKRRPHPGTEKCVKHGSGAPQVRAAAQRRLAEERAEKLIATLIDPDAPPVTDPLGDLAKRAGQAGSMLDSLMRRVNALEKLEYSSESGKRDLVPLVAAVERALAQQRAFLAELARAGVEDRRVRLEEGQVAAVVGVLRSVGAGLLARVCAEVPTEVSAILRAVWPVWEGEVIGGAVRELGAGGPSGP